MVPPSPPQAATDSELDFFKLLEGLGDPDDGVVFTSLNLADHEYKKWGEVDFVLVSPQGLLAIELKGGQVHCDERGVWRYESRRGAPIERMESPMAQVSSAYFSLRDKVLYPSVGKQLINAAPSGFGVVLARTSLRDAGRRGLIGGAEMPAELVATSDDVRSVATLAEALSRFHGYWRTRHSRKPRLWTKDEVRAVATAIRPWFDRVVPLSLTAARIREEQLSLTEEQYGVLDFSDSAERVICEGGAGCGKTLLAVECMRREATRNPLLVTGTDSLAAHLRASPGANPDRIKSYLELAAMSPAERGIYGSLVVDEGQQLTNKRCIDLLSSVVAGGVSAGRWRWFSDPNNQVMPGGEFDAECHRSLRQLAFPGRLGQNCRNTPQIVHAVEALTGADMGSRVAKGHGPEVIFAASSERDKQIEAAVDTLRRWLEDPEIVPGDIVLLSPGPIENSSIPGIVRRLGSSFRSWEAGWHSSPHRSRCFCASTVETFRGIEAPFVVLCDVDGAVTEPSIHFYLGMTRANFGLFVMADHEVVTNSAVKAASLRASTPIGRQQ